LRLGDEKMSKSLGNVLTIKELVKRHDPEALRIHLLGTHYRSPLDFAEERVREAQKSLLRFRLLFEEAERPTNRVRGKLEERFTDALGQMERRFAGAMDDDFNTPQALGLLYDLVRMTNSVRAEGTLSFLAGVAMLRRLAAVLGLFTGESAPPPSQETALDPEEIERLIQARNQARRERKWEEADKIRHELGQLGIIIEDRPDGTIWRRQR
jgi:cysteinyl-tRNA synthetase